ncbi:MAG: chromosome segregation protein SMC [Eubacteriales bacterium]|nr:chromosome segregation protein SMC [Eubacteriales bacterium]
MYLKEVEINGFKSFADKIQLKFDQGITAIVGPNGSGKSNVVDAIRWVLGEQKVKELRGERMDDVIFSGTQHRRSQGFAYVSMTLDNRDKSLPVEYEEIKVSRKLYRSGESEYRINDKTCRLKDIHEVFYDTGIGKEGYSIIGQGQIDKILSGKPDMRRELIDEAVGIVKFKKRKAETRKKLADEEMNRLRILDILSEMEHQIGPLEKQADKARQYLRYKDELRRYELFEFIRSYEEMSAALKRLEENITDVRRTLEEKRHAVERRRAEHQSLDAETDRLEQAIHEHNERIKDVLKRMSDIGSGEKLLEQKIDFLRRHAADLATRRDILREQLSVRSEEADKAEEKADEYRVRYAEIEESLIPLRERLQELAKTAAADKERLAALTGTAETLRDRELAINRDLSYHRAVSEQQGDKDAAAAAADRQLTAEAAALHERCEKLAHALAEKEAEEHRLTERKDELRVAVTAAAEDIRKQRETLSLKDRTLAKDMSRCHVLENMATRYEGYGHAVRRVMEHFPKGAANRGVVADLISVDKRYETAIETALGGSLQHIVTDTEDTAKSMITLLRKNRWGRATFLPLNNLRPRQRIRDKKVLSAAGIIDVAVNLATLPAGYDILGDYLLGNTLVAETVDDAVRLNKSTSGYRIVTTTGELLMPTGSISGGSFKNTSNLLSRTRELDELQKTVAAQTEEMERLRSALDAAVTAQKERQGILNDTYDEREILRLSLAKDRETLENERARLTAVRETLAARSADREAVRDAFETAKERVRTLTAEAASVTADKEATATALADLHRKDAERALEQSDCEASVNESEREMAAVRQALNFVDETAKRLFREAEDLRRRLDETVCELSETESEKATREAEAGGTADMYEALKAEHAGDVQAVRALSEAHRQLKEKNKAVYEERERLNQSVFDLEKEHIRLENIYEKQEERFHAKVDYIWDEYALTYSEARDMEMPDYSDVAVEKEIEGRKRKIRAMGSINVNAVEEYRGLKERYEFLEKQKNDIEEAEKKLNGLIRELDEGMVEQFREKFGILEAAFERIFTVLFGGGQASMEILDPTDILASGININAQPPGKKLQNMLQLSGGEKALTAISLMFAIQQLNPSPFCFLDEIEAALDEHNVYRFAEYLGNLTEHTQFIVITHRKGTMESADRLYGVTMQEKGVSTLVSVALV